MTFLNHFRMRTFFLMLTLGSSAFAAEAEVMLIRNVLLFDSTGKSPFAADIEIRNGRFTKIGQSLTAIDGTTIVDGSGLSLLPGLIDVHVHWTSSETLSRADIATQLLVKGVTTATDYHSAPESFAPKRRWHQQLVSPHLVYIARTGTPGGHGADWGDENMTRLATSPAEGKYAIEKVSAFSPDVVKVFADGWRYGSKINNSSINIDALSAIVAEARKHQRPVVTHTVTVDGAKTAAEAGVTAIVHAVQDRKADQELIDLMKVKKVFYAPTLAVYEPQPEKLAAAPAVQRQLVMYRQKMSEHNLQQFILAGIPVALGTDSGIGDTKFGESTLHELELLVKFGMKPADALIAGTANSAAVLGLNNDRGTIEIGKRADFVLVKGKPWQRISDYRNISKVFVDGELVAEDGKLSKPQGPVVPESVKAVSLIDDFQRLDGLTAGQASRLAETDIGFPRSQMISQIVKRSETNMALFVSAKLAQKDTPSALVVLPLSPGSVVPVDASAFKGIEFDVRGDKDYLLEVNSRAGRAQQVFEASNSWQTIRVPFSELTGSLSLTQIYSVKLGAKRSRGTMFWLELDNVRFY